MPTNSSLIKCDPPVHKGFQDLTGQQYERLTVVGYYGKKEYVRKSGKRAGETRCEHYWLCQCECGEQKVVLSSHLRTGSTTSCGCYQREVKTSHGLACHPSYMRYHQMVRRCTDPTAQNYADYGGRGITIYPDWLEQEDDKGLKRYLWYLDNILGPCPAPEYSIDRKENDHGYYPWNLRWADKTEQVRNRRNVKLTRDDALVIKFGNLPGTHQEIADQFGVGKSIITRIRNGKTWADLTQADYAALTR